MDKTTVLKGNDSSQLHPVVDPNDRFGDKYSITSRLGVPSGQADLYLCEYKAKPYIVKLFKPGIIVNKSALSKIRAIKSKRIVPVLDYGTHQGRFYEVTPYYSKGDLSRIERVSENTLREVVIPFINMALKDVHAKGMAHMDLKPSNIFFVSEDDELHLGDFGICSVLADESIKVTTAKGTFGYRPPESYSEISIKSEQFDYYSFGMTIIHMWKGKSPYAGLSEMQIMAHTLDGKILLPEDMPQDLKVLIQGLTAYDKKKRLGYTDVDRWCKGFDISSKVDLESTKRRRSILFDGYSFKGETLQNMSDLAVVVTSSQENWYEGIRRFRMGHLDEFIETCGHDEAAVLSEVKQIENDDIAMSLLLLKTSHDGVICWKSSRYKTLKDFGNGLQNSLPEIMPEISEMQEAGMVDSIVDYF